MSVLSLCNKTCYIYSIGIEIDQYGVYSQILTLKYDAVPCRISPRKNNEDISDGKEKEKPSDYRIYISENLDISSKDIIMLDNRWYDVKYNNTTYYHHLQTDVKILEITETNLVYIVTEDNVHILTQGGDRLIVE